MKKYLALMLLTVGFAAEVSAQELAVKSNLLYDLTTTINLGMEMSLSKRTTLDLSANYNAWTFSDNRKMKHWLAQPEYRYWLCERFNRAFFGIHAHGGQFNFGGMTPYGFNHGKIFGVQSHELAKYRYEGWFVGAGLSYGYHWALSPRWSVEAVLGVGYAYLKYDKYPCYKCGEKIRSGDDHYFGPTKLAVNLIYIIK